MGTFRDLTGQRFGRLTAQWIAGHKGTKTKANVYWLCLCNCGNLKVVRGSHLTEASGTRSCGCLLVKHGLNKNGDHAHGHSVGKLSPEYASWSNAIQRCTNPKHPRFPDWGGRGIKFCDRWKDFPHFLADMGEKPEPKNMYSIDRIDNDGNYEPGNCRWATRKEQEANKRRHKKAA